jgi:hypothetical protein
MNHWVADLWLELLFGFLFGVLGSPVRRLLLRFIISSGACLIAYKVAVEAAAHAGFRWSNEAAAYAVFGVLLGCLVRPLGAFSFRYVRSAFHHNRRDQ